MANQSMCATARAHANLVAAPGDIDLGCAGSYAEGAPLACVVQGDGAIEVEVRANTGGRCVCATRHIVTHLWQLSSSEFVLAVSSSSFYTRLMYAKNISLLHRQQLFIAFTGHGYLCKLISASTRNASPTYRAPGASSLPLCGLPATLLA